MHFLDGSYFPENQEKLVITVAPYGPQWEPADFPEDLPVTMEQHVQQAVDCYNAGATVLHLHVREADGKGSKRLVMYNELLARLREAVPDMILQVGGSISFSPEDEDADAKWLSDDMRHMLAELKPAPDQVTVAINTSQMNIVELGTPADYVGTSFARQEIYDTYEEMIVPSNPQWAREHVRRLQAAKIQPHFQITSKPNLLTLERMIRAGVYKGPANLTWVAVGGGFDTPDPYSMTDFLRHVPDGATLTVEAQMRSNLPVNTMAIAMGLHVRCGNEDNLWAPNGERSTSVQQVERLVRIARELGRDVANGKEAKAIYRIGKQYRSTEETLAELRYPVGQRPHLPALAERKVAA
jgi:uncharacterized protein (DUF849 family)